MTTAYTDSAINTVSATSISTGCHPRSASALTLVFTPAAAIATTSVQPDTFVMCVVTLALIHPKLEAATKAASAIKKPGMSGARAVAATAPARPATAMLRCARNGCRVFVLLALMAFAGEAPVCTSGLMTSN